MLKKRLDYSQLKVIQLNILKDVDAFCRENNITYYLTYGTLLGAVRHQGYIPWDDDIDIAMPRKDYEKFLSNYNLNGSKKNVYQVVAIELNNAYPYPFGKVQDLSTVLLEYSDINYPLGINIDIFPIDGLPVDLNKSDKHFLKIKWLMMIMNLKKVKITIKRSFLKNLILLIGKILTLLIPYRFIVCKMSYIAQRYDYEKSDYVSNLSCPDGKHERTSKRVFENSIEILFEGNNFYAPIGYHEWLHNIYGDYMKMPPVPERVSHHKFEIYKIL